MTKYTTVEGHEIIPNYKYETRNGVEILIIGFSPDEKYPVVGYVDKTKSTDMWTVDGCYLDDQQSDFDLIRPFKPIQKIPTFREAMESKELGIGGYSVKPDNQDVYTALIYSVSDYLERFLTKESK